MVVSVVSANVPFVDTFDLLPETPIGRSYEWPAVLTGPDAGVVVVRQIELPGQWDGTSTGPVVSAQTKVRRWTLNFRLATLANHTRLLALWTLTRGGVTPLKFTPPGESDVVYVVFENSSLQTRQVAHEVFAFSVSLRQLLPGTVWGAAEQGEHQDDDVGWPI